MLDFNQINRDFEKNRKKVLDGLNLDNKPLCINDRRGEGKRNRVAPGEGLPCVDHSIDAMRYALPPKIPPYNPFTGYDQGFFSKEQFDHLHNVWYDVCGNVCPIIDPKKEVGGGYVISEDDIVNLRIDLGRDEFFNGN